MQRLTPLHSLHALLSHPENKGSPSSEYSDFLRKKKKPVSVGMLRPGVGTAAREWGSNDRIGS